MAVNTSIGTILSVSHAEPATYTLAGFSALSYTEVGEVITIPEVGGTANIITREPLKTGVIDKRPGSIDYGSTDIAITKDLTDAGQALLKAGFDGVNKGDVHSFKIYNATVGTIYFTGIIASDVVNPGSTSDFFSGTVKVELNNKLVTSGDASFWTVTYAAGSNGSLIGPVSQIVEDGEDASPIYAVADALYEFEKWSDDETDNPRTDTAVAANISVTASFVLS